MALDIEKYLPYLDEYHWSREEKINMLYHVSRMMEAQADKIFGVHAVQLACAQKENKPSQTRQKSIDSKSNLLSLHHRRAANDHLTDAAPITKGKRHV
ncbi:hypothetical protein AB835_10900 [Candidatus Endobugula sertula]|uniref:Uncharacterized protein n=1 Tax=Candidatus Endobugula sertula TaxID=62101 RepID=A0A1D2QNA5_9GAMM|nr:hypothetical protein AB835_10900 [Candidatus Endobugula sertula]